jgi:hypothetical protein
MPSVVGIGLVLVLSVLSWGIVAVPAGGAQTDYVVIGKGKIGSDAWASWLEDVPKQTAGGQWLCLSIALEHSVGGVGTSESYECGAVSNAAPMVTSVTAGSGMRQRSVVVGVFGPGTRKLMLDLGSRGRKVIQAKRLSLQKATQLGIRAVAHWAQGFSGPVCLHQITAYGEQERVLSDSGPMPCPRNKSSR